MPNDTYSRTARRKKKQQKKKPLWKKILLVIGIAFLAIGIGIGSLFLYYIATAPAIDASKLSDPFSSQYYDMDGDMFAESGSEQRTKIEYDDLPQVLIDAVTATEDARFFKHSGIDIRRIGGAIKANLTGGFGSEGASTITQQVIENAFLSKEKKIKRKVQEQWLALKLEREYSKEQIMEMYLNKIFYGSRAYGVAKASEIYFGKTDLHELTLPEAAILAGLPQRPTAYNPYENPDLMEGRVNTVLKLMVRHGKITEEQADEARQVDIESLLAGEQPESNKYEAFIQKVRKEVEEKLDGADIDTDGLKIYTTLDNKAQDHVEFLLTDSEDNPIPYPDDEMQTGVTVLDTNNGAIRAIGGRRNSEKADQFNYAFQGGSQPGSTFKPIIAYGPAIEYNKWSTYEQINDDQPYKIPGTEDEIRNWNRQYQGWMTARYALSRSLNVPTVKTFVETGYDNAKSFAEGLGIKFHEDEIKLTDAIGGTETNTTPLQLAGAFRAFGNEGIYNEPYAVTKVEFPDGKVVELKPEPEAAMSDYTAYMITDMLKTVMSEGTGTSANIPGLPVAGKTGTTNLKGKEGSADAWFSGYTTNYTISIWAGGYTEKNDEGKEVRAVMPTEGTAVPRAIFKNLMTEISKDVETADFVKPDSVVEVAVEKGSNPAKLASAYTPQGNIVTELFVKGYEPSETSDKFDELEPVTNLHAAYAEEDNAIDVSWDYNSDLDVEFEVSASVNGGQMNVLSTVHEKSLSITEVEEGADYTIRVVVINKEDNNRSGEVTTKVKIPEEAVDEDPEEPDEDEDEAESIPSVSNLSSQYKEAEGIIDVSWQYNGPPATFEVDVNGDQKQTVSNNGIEIGGLSPGQTYVITVTPIGNVGGNEGVRGDPQSVTEVIEELEEDPDDED